jgi:DNA mismatch endonuclease (patch repair protein)
VPTPWNDATPPEKAWRPRRNARQAYRVAEQDKAAGGREARERPLGHGGTARASICLRVYGNTRRIRAYLRWSDRGTTRECYVGEVGYSTRAENLSAGWTLARDLDLLAPTTDPGLPASWASSPSSRAVMRANRGRDTKPEMLIRSLLHSMGLRYRVSRRPVPELRRTADLVFGPARTAVFVDGCYWHGCPEHHRPARSNGEFWRTKIDGNRRRDDETNRLLAEAGWHVIRVWEHESPAEAAGRIAEVVRGVQRADGRVERESTSD